MLLDSPCFPLCGFKQPTQLHCCALRNKRQQNFDARRQVFYLSVQLANCIHRRFLRTYCVLASIRCNCDCPSSSNDHNSQDSSCNQYNENRQRHPDPGVVRAKLLLNLLEKVNGGLGIVATVKFGADTQSHLLEISSSHLSAKIASQVEKWLLALSHDENYCIWSCPVRAFGHDIAIVGPQTAPREFILAYSNHTGICLKGIIHGLGLIQYISDSTSKQLGIVGDGVAA